MYNTTYSPQHYQHQQQGAYLKRAGAEVASERNRERWANIVFLFSQNPVGRQTASFLLAPAPLNLDFRCWKSLNRRLWHRAPHDTIRGWADRYLSWDMKPRWHPKSKASSPEPFHSRLEFPQSGKTQRLRPGEALSVCFCWCLDMKSSESRPGFSSRPRSCVVAWQEAPAHRWEGERGSCVCQGWACAGWNICLLHRGGIYTVTERVYLHGINKTMEWNRKSSSE